MDAQSPGAAPQRAQDAPHPDELRNADRRTVTVWSDLGCPWATLALHTLRTRARESGRTVLIDHRAFPLELFNRMPTPKGILDAEIVTIAGHRPELGWRAWAAPDSTYPVTMLPPMEAVQAAKAPEVGGLPAADELDAALRRAFYVDSRCISVHSVIMEVAESCAQVDTGRLEAALARGSARAEIHRQFGTARGLDVQGSPHLFAVGGFAVHNPGATYHWTAAPPTGFPRLDAYDPSWADELIDLLDN